MHPLIQLAKEAIENYLKEGKIILPPSNLPKEFLEKKAGVFVTLEKKGQLRGCVGTYLPTQKNIAQELIHSAIAAAAKDYRFQPLKVSELPYLNYEVSILSPPEQVSNLKELDPKKYGVIVKSADNPLQSGLLLPNLKGVDTIEKQISIACQKGGIDPRFGRIIVYKFKVEKFS